MRKKAIALLLLAAFTFESIGSAAAGNVQPESSVVIDESGTDADIQVIGSKKEDAAWIISETDDAAEVSDETVGKTAQLSTGSLSDEAGQTEAGQIETGQTEVGQIEAGQTEAETAQSVADEQTEDIDLSSGDAEDSEFQILDMEEVSLDDANLVAETDMLDDQETFEEVTISLDESGTAETATLSLARLRSKARSAVSNEQSFTSYGDQLTGAAADLYKEMEEEYKKLEETYGAEDAEYTGAQDQKLPSFQVELDDTYSCVLTEEERNSSTKRSENEDYQDMSAQVKAPMQAAYDAYLFDHPEAYWMGSPSITFSLSFTKLSDGSYTCKVVSPATVTTKQNYDGFITAISTYNSEVQTAVDEITSSLEEDSTRQETLKAIHDYLCERLGYDSNYSSYTSDSLEYKKVHTAAGVFVFSEHQVVCDGYAKSFKVLCDQFGIDCVVIPGYAGGAHAWNYVKMEDDQWYLVDVTWDDKTTILYNYFLIGSETVPSGYSKPVSQLRTVYTNFSNAKYTMTFTAPSLAEVVYHIHSWSNYQPDENATCTEDGTKTAVCDFEGCKVTDTQADTGSALGHSFLNYVSDGNATCTEDGTQTAQCERCDVTDTQADAGSSLGHSFLNYVSDGNATCTGDGTQTAQCERCDETDTQADADSALGHSFPSWQQITAATVQKAAVLQRICTVCKVKEEKTSGTALTPTIQLTASSIRLKVKQSTTAVQVSGLAAGDFVVSWSSDDTSLVKVNQKGRIKAGNKTGTTYVNVTLASGLTRKIKVKVQKHSVKTTAITGIASKLKLNAGTKLKLTPVLAPITSIQKITYTSSNKKVASVSSKGVIRAKKAGRTTIRVKSGDKVVKCIVIVK